MNEIIEKISTFFTSEFQTDKFFVFGIVAVIGMLILSLISRAIFGKKATLAHATSSAIAILGIYIITVVIISTNSKLDFILSPLPFVTISGEYMRIFNILNADMNAICTQVLNMVILAFLMNLLESWLPKGKKLLSWYAFRFLSVILAICLHYVVNLVLAAIVPAGFADIAPTVLTVILVAALLLGALKLLVGTALVFIDPLLGIFYTFFFSNLVGRQLTRAILTTAILTALVCFLNYLGVASVFIASAALIAYIPFLLIMLVLWYVVGHLM